MNNALIHKNVSNQIDTILKNPPQALVILGSSGINKVQIAHYIAKNYFTNQSSYNQNVMEVKPSTDRKYGVDVISDILHFIKISSISNSKINKIIIINDAELLSHPAQTQLLSPLENSNTKTLWLLLVSDQTKLLSTIISRCQILYVVPPEKKQILKHFQELGYEDSEIEKAYQMSGALPEIIEIILEKSDQSILESVNNAKKLVTQNIFNRLIMIDDMNLSKDDLIKLTNVLQQMAHIAIQNNNQNAVKWLQIMIHANEAEHLLNHNVSTKLVTGKLILSL